MTHTFSRVSLSLAFCFLAACGKAPEQQLLDATGSEAILPLHEKFLAESLSLSQNTSAFCAQNSRSAEDLAALRDRWVAAMNGWEGIQSIQFGPVTDDNQAWKVQFWPDRKNLIARKTEQFVIGDEAITLPALQDSSVVIQGLSAMEYLLYDKPAAKLIGPDGQGYCDHLNAAASNLQQVADFLHEGWHPSGKNYLGTWQSPGPDNLDYPDENAAIGALIETIVYGLERIKRDKLQRPLGLEGGQANTFLLEWWRSQQSREAILINLHSLQLLYSAGNGAGLNELLQARGATELSDTVTTQFDRAISAIASLEGSLEQNHAKAANAESLETLYATLTDLLAAFKREIPSTLGITLGFNANDGD
ncbi:hypothetical protein FHR99_002532 [Litorivivens lipolytica]|uniref:Imelysin-like domain-containing protein n=1 Tax=Litorivivens lipolytica TaxID=1524264 RepID=A0A7W4Z6H0_9GAMM|nr:imelysin family protein [Litorivivens lipolytica]MBB3048258.1 hypothetical protein [Litorivivens lipolytica]